MNSTKENETYLIILGAGASRSSGFPLASALPDAMLEMATSLPADRVERKLLEIVGEQCKTIGVTTVDELAAFIKSEYDNSTIRFSFYYLAQWSTCALFRCLEQKIPAVGIQSYKSLFDELDAMSRQGPMPHILSFNYDGALKSAYHQIYQRDHTGQLEYFSGQRPWAFGTDDDIRDGGFFYHKAHGSTGFKVPMSSQGNGMPILPLPDNELEAGCRDILDFYRADEEGRSGRRFPDRILALPMITFPSHFELFQLAPEMTRVFREWIVETRRRWDLVLNHAVGAKAIGYSFPELDRDEWLPILRTLWENERPLHVQAGGSGSIAIVERLRRELKSAFPDASESRLGELVQAIPSNF